MRHGRFTIAGWEPRVEYLSFYQVPKDCSQHGMRVWNEKEWSICL